MPRDDEKAGSSTEKPSTDQPKGDQLKADQPKGTEALKEQPKWKSAPKVRSAAERLRRNPWR